MPVELLLKLTCRQAWGSRGDQVSVSEKTKALDESPFSLVDGAVCSSNILIMNANSKFMIPRSSNCKEMSQTISNWP